MANSRRFEEAAALAASSWGRDISIGCHVVLVDGEPLLPVEQVSGLVEPGASPARFRPGLARFVRAAVSGRIPPGQIEQEASAQMRRIQAAGVELSHFDTHKHVHLFPAVLKPLLRAAQGCGVRAVRNPFAPVKPLAFSHLFRRPRLWKRYTQVRVLRAFEAGFQEQVANAGMVTTDGTFGVVVTGVLDITLFRAIVGGLPEGTWELVCHPGHNDAELGAVRTRLRQSRAEELRVLVSAEARAALEEHGIRLMSYRELAQF
jgi:predicted glycoside hydrolase/deacetylase ChbG (UPF0249 family)